MNLTTLINKDNKCAINAGNFTVTSMHYSPYKMRSKVGVCRRRCEPICTDPLAPDALISSLHIRLSFLTPATKFLMPDQIKPDHRLQLKDQEKRIYNINISSKLLFQLSLGAQHFMRILPLSAWLEQSKLTSR